MKLAILDHFGNDLNPGDVVAYAYIEGYDLFCVRLVVQEVEYLQPNGLCHPEWEVTLFDKTTQSQTVVEGRWEDYYTKCVSPHAILIKLNN